MLKSLVSGLGMAAGCAAAATYIPGFGGPWQDQMQESALIAVKVLGGVIVAVGTARFITFIAWRNKINSAVPGPNGMAPMRELYAAGLGEFWG